MKSIAEGNNPHIVALIGCVTEREPLCLITEYLPYGDLLSYLHSIRKMVMMMRKKIEILGVYTHNKTIPPPPPPPHTHTQLKQAFIDAHPCNSGAADSGYPVSLLKQ